jgi:hypothetical protein
MNLSKLLIKEETIKTTLASYSLKLEYYQYSHGGGKGYQIWVHEVVPVVEKRLEKPRYEYKLLFHSFSRSREEIEKKWTSWVNKVTK